MKNVVPDSRSPFPRLISNPLGTWGLTGLLLFLGGLLSFWFADRAQRSEQQRISENFRSLTNYQIAANDERIGLIFELLAGIRRAVLYQDTLTRAEFDGLCREIFDTHTGILSLQWVMEVPADRRREVERQLGADYGYPITFKHRTPANTFAPAPPAEAYRVIRYATPLEPNAIVLGYDITSAPTFADQEYARLNNSTAISTPFRLAQTNRDDEEFGIIFILPVIVPNPGGSPTLRGFVQAVFKVSGIFEPAILDQYSDHAVYRYYDQSVDPAHPVLLYSTTERRTNPLAVGPDPSSETSFPRTLQQVIKVANREWMFRADARPEWIHAASSHESELILFAGLGMTALIALLFHGFARREHWAQKLIQERTEALVKGQRELQGIIDNSPNAIWIKDTAGRYILANQKMQMIYGEEVGSIIGQSDELFYPPDIAADMRAADERALRSDSHILVEGEYTIHGEQRYFYTVKFPLRDEQGVPFGIGGIATDVTTFKRVENQLAETQKLESLGVLAGGIAHDFNNLLTGMLGNASLMSVTLPPGDANRELAGEIETAARRAAELCRQMLAYSGRGKFVIERLNFTKAVEELVPLLRSSISSRTELRLHLDPQLPSIDADPSQLRQIIMNLVINASEALPESGGWVAVSSSSRYVISDHLREAIGHPDLLSGDYVSFRVQDNGSGMDEETQRRIFEPFFTTKFTGRGLGLSAVLGIVRSHQGALLVESALGHGTTFELLLPVAEGEADAQLAQTQPPFEQPPLRGLRVFLTEDETAVYRLITRVLAQAGAHVTAYENGAQAAAEFMPGKHDLAILDLTLPGLDGREVLVRLRDRQPDLPVLLISGYSEQEAYNHLTSVKPNGFLQKPFSSDELLAQIATIRAS